MMWSFLQWLLPISFSLFLAINGEEIIRHEKSIFPALDSTFYEEVELIQMSYSYDHHINGKHLLILPVHVNRQNR